MNAFCVFLGRAWQTAMWLDVASQEFIFVTWQGQETRQPLVLPMNNWERQHNLAQELAVEQGLMAKQRRPSPYQPWSDRDRRLYKQARQLGRSLNR